MPVNATLPILIQALLEPRRYPGDAGHVELVQTHISWVLLAGAFAYKIKKPVILPFLDFSTLALRKKYCEDELRLNRRFSPDIYQDVVAIFHTLQDPRFEGSGQPIEYAVRMHRFDEAARLDRVCTRGELHCAHLSGLAGTLAAFHATALRAAPGSRHGSPAEVMAPMRDSLRDLLAWSPDTAVTQRLQALQAWTETQFEELEPLLHKRQQSGWVRECHGDLHLANLVLINDRVQMFDCIEFNDELRWIDVASEIAFTYIDLISNAQPGMANWFVNEMWDCTGDYEAVPVFRFYAVYRALVRAKVSAIRMRQTHQDDAQALAYLALAAGLTLPQPLRLVITHGLSGCGKTMASSALLQSDSHACTVRVRSDTERKRISGLAGSAHSASGLGAGIYTADMDARTYRRLMELTGSLLDAGWSVIVDATFLKRADRASFRALAQRVGAAFSILAPEATSEQLRERLVARHEQGTDASEATLDVLSRQLDAMEPLTSQERAWTVTVDEALGKYR
jgi:aminoglycoside phosphotransferase family enzyme/predicted kinase